MKITTKSEYSLLALIYIARYQKKGFIKIENICKKYNIPRKYLEQLFYILKENNYIETKRGIGGGYLLVKEPNKITLAEIIRLMDGPLASTKSVSKYFYSQNKIEIEKKLTVVLKEIRDFVAKKLEKLTLKDLI